MSHLFLIFGSFYLVITNIGVILHYILKVMPRKKKILKPKPDMNVNGEFVNKEPNKPTKVLNKQLIKERLCKLQKNKNNN